LWAKREIAVCLASNHFGALADDAQTRLAVADGVSLLQANTLDEWLASL